VGRPLLNRLWAFSSARISETEIYGVFFTFIFAVLPLNIFYRCIHRVPKNVPPMTCYNFETHKQILIFFGRNVTDKVGNQNML